LQQKGEETPKSKAVEENQLCLCFFCLEMGKVAVLGFVPNPLKRSESAKRGCFLFSLKKKARPICNNALKRQSGLKFLERAVFE